MPITVTVIHKLTDKVTIMVIRNSMMWYRSLKKINKKSKKNRFKSKKSDLNQKNRFF